jgi:transposase
MTQYSFAATVKAMKIQEVILKAASGEILWIDAADIIGVSYRTMKRWKSNYEEFGYDGIFDWRMKTPSLKRAPLSEVQTILRLYRTHYKGFNATHFHEKLKEHHNIHRGYTFVKKLLQTAGEIDKIRTRDKHRIRRPRKPLVGMMLHLDGSSHEWIPDLPGVFYDLLVLLDDATNRIYEMVLVDEEDTLQCMILLRDCVAKHGIFCSLYSDRATHFFYTPKSGEKVQEGHLTQIGRALSELGIRMIPAYSPQARGRGERMNETLQGRLPNEFRLHGIKAKEQANRFLKDHYIAELNKRFAKTPEQSGSAFVPVAPHVDINLIFSIKSERTVNQDNTVSFQNQIFQISPSQLRVSFAKCRVTVHQHLDSSVSITYGPHLLGYYAPNNIPKNSPKQKTLCLT